MQGCLHRPATSAPNCSEQGRDDPASWWAPGVDSAARCVALRAHVRLVQRENLPLCQVLNVVRLARVVAQAGSAA